MQWLLIAGLLYRLESKQGKHVMWIRQHNYCVRCGHSVATNHENRKTIVAAGPGETKRMCELFTSRAQNQSYFTIQCLGPQQRSIVQ